MEEESIVWARKFYEAGRRGRKEFWTCLGVGDYVAVACRVNGKCYCEEQWLPPRDGNRILQLFPSAKLPAS